MNKPITLPTTTAVALAVVIGVGSATLLEVLRPASVWLAKALLSVVTLGVDSVRDRMYETAVTTIGSPSGAGHSTFSAGALQLSTLVLAIAWFWLRKPGNEKYRFASWMLLSVASTFVFVSAIKGAYVNGLAYHKAKLEVLVAPYLSDLEIKKLKVRAMNSRGRAGYIAYTEELNEILKSNGQRPIARDYF